MASNWDGGSCTPTGISFSPTDCFFFFLFVFSRYCHKFSIEVHVAMTMELKQKIPAKKSVCLLLCEPQTKNKELSNQNIHFNE